MPVKAIEELFQVPVIFKHEDDDPLKDPQAIWTLPLFPPAPLPLVLGEPGVREMLPPLEFAPEVPEVPPPPAVNVIDPPVPPAALAPALPPMPAAKLIGPPAPPTALAPVPAPPAPPPIQTSAPLPPP